MLVCRSGCSSVSWCPYRPTASEGVIILRVAVGAGDSCVHVLKSFRFPSITCRCLSSPVNPWEVESKLRGHSDRVRDVRWRPFIGVPVNLIASLGRVGVGLRWDGYDCLFCIWIHKNGDAWTTCHKQTYTDPVWRVSWSITGNLLAVSHGVDQVDLWKEMIDGSWRIVNREEKN